MIIRKTSKFARADTLVIISFSVIASNWIPSQFILDISSYIMHIDWTQRELSQRTHCTLSDPRNSEFNPAYIPSIC